MTDETFGTWLLAQLTDSSLREVHLSLQDERGWLAPDQLKHSDDDTYTFTRDDGGNPTEHYHLVTNDTGDLERECWRRYEYTEAGEHSAEFRTQLILELPPDDDILDWMTDSVSLTAGEFRELVAHDAVQSVAAGRVAGLDRQKHDLQEFLRMSNAEWGLADRTGILLEGPPGTGKTELVIETCQEEYNAMPVTISGPEILSKWVGESERLLRKKFDEAQNTDSNVLYIDEIDAIARSRSEASQEHSAQLVAQLLVLLDGVDAKTEDAPKVIASTNLAEVLDPALLRPGRLGNQPISFPHPDDKQRQAIIHHYVEQIRRRNPEHLQTDLQEVAKHPTRSRLLSELSELTDGFTGADIEDVFIEAAVKAQTGSDEGQQLTASSIRALIDDRDIQHSNFYTDQELPFSKSARRTVRFASAGDVAVIDEDDPVSPESIADAWVRERDEPSQSRFREATLTDLLVQDPTDTRDRIVEIFQRNADDGLCLYIAGLPRLMQMKEHTSLANLAVETIHEQLLQWNTENLLLHDMTTEQESSGRLAGEYREYTHQ
jgi:transitional endoplasmic reticulum ATPase